MKIYKEGGLTYYSPREVKLNKDTKGILSKTASGHIHMDLYDKYGPKGDSLEFAGKLISGVFDLFK